MIGQFKLRNNCRLGLGPTKPLWPSQVSMLGQGPTYFFRRATCQHSLYRFNAGFTLVEVLLALAVIAIALTALLKITAQNIENTQRLKEKTISHWVAMQGVAMIQLNLIQVNQSQESTQTTTMLGEQWYWRAQISATPVKKMQQISISISKKPTGPYREELTAFRYIS